MSLLFLISVHQIIAMTSAPVISAATYGVADTRSEAEAARVTLGSPDAPFLQVSGLL